MRVSDNEIKKLKSGHYAVVSDIVELGQTIQTREKEADIIKQVSAEVMAMPDREDLVADLKARIESGNYNPSSDDIADAMIRRSIADRLS